ncbi:hypothetical protein ANRL1_04913 [Anaerolineae bacterium]|nr:hypothetical protein ANRL1_04913 [Anaerolineae bacterium]
MKSKLTWIFLVFAVGWLLIIQPPLPPRIGQIDFPAYWSASYLLAHGENFGDPGRLFQAEKTLTTWPEDYPMLTWNPPWLLTMLIPYTWVSFDRATWWWLLTNITLIFISAVVLWQMSAANERTRRLALFAPLVAFAYSPTLATLIAGQVNVIVLAGLTGFLFFSTKRQHGRAGIALALTLVKIHLVYITIPLLLLRALREHRWRMLAGFFGTLAVLSSVVFVLRPTFLFEYNATVSGGGLLDYMTPTAGGILALLFGWNGFKLMGLVILPLGLWIGWRASSVQVSMLVDATLLASVITAPFCWSYDFVILLVPLIPIIVSLVKEELTQADASMIGAILLCADAVMFYQRVTTPGEEYFFWVPWLITGLFVWVRIRRGQMKYA